MCDALANDYDSAPFSLFLLVLDGICRVKNPFCYKKQDYQIIRFCLL